MLDTVGAEALNGRGDMFFLSDKNASVIRLQTVRRGLDSMDNIIWHFADMKKSINTDKS